jgi:hypothetical protein
LLLFVNYNSGDEMKGDVMGEACGM